MFIITKLSEHHLDNNSKVAYSAILINESNGKQIEVELAEGAQGIVAYCPKNDVLYPLITEKKRILDLRDGEEVDIEAAIVRTDN